MGWFLALLAAAPPALLEPQAARARALAEEAPTLAEAEALLLARDAVGGLSRLDRVAADPSRRARLELDLALAARELGRAEAALRTLSADPGWQAHARSGASALAALEVGRDRAGFGRVLFALALAALLIGGSRELLLPRAPTLALSAVVLAAGLLTWRLAPALAPLLGVAQVAMLALVHAGLASIRRVQPTPRGRVFVAVVVLLGTVGAYLAALSPIPRGALLGALP